MTTDAEPGRPVPVTVTHVRRSTARIQRLEQQVADEKARRQELIRGYVIEQGGRPGELAEAAACSAEHVARLARGYTSGKAARPYGQRVADPAPATTP